MLEKNLLEKYNQGYIVNIMHSKIRRLYQCLEQIDYSNELQGYEIKELKSDIDELRSILSLEPVGYNDIIRMVNSDYNWSRIPARLS